MLLEKCLSGFAVVVLFSSLCEAANFTVIGACEAKPLFEKQVQVSASTLGDLTIEVLQQYSIAFVGDRSGIKSIENSPVGDDALEVLSDSQMRAYGWCVSIDGKQPGLMPDEVQLKGNTKEIVWFFASAEYDKGEWKNFCTPSYLAHSLPICQKKR